MKDGRTRAVIVAPDHPAHKLDGRGLVADPWDVDTTGISEESFLKPWLGKVDSAARQSVVPAEVAPVTARHTLHEPSLEGVEAEPLDTLDDEAPQSWWRRLFS